MSAHCSTCGSDIVYPEGTWPLGECPTCTRDERIAAMDDLLRRIAEWDMLDVAADGPFWRREIARVRARPVSPADTTEGTG